LKLDAKIISRYTGREFSRYFSSAINTLRKNGIDEIVALNGLDVLGKRISDELWADSQEKEGPLKRPPTKSAPRKERKRKANMNSEMINCLCPGWEF
jgi:hypothetical protein